MKLLIIGHARHGKDTFAEILRDRYGLKFISSSLFAAERVVRGALAQQGITYPSVEACYADRAKHRAAWFQAIAAYNADNPAKLAGEIFSEHDMYVGLRSLREFVAGSQQGLWDAVIWVDRAKRKTPESRNSMQLTPNLADIIIDNNGSLSDLSLQADWAWYEAWKLAALRTIRPAAMKPERPGAV